MSIEEDVKALREALADRPDNLSTNSVSDCLEALRARRDWLYNLSALCTPDRISRLLAELEARGKDAERYDYIRALTRGARDLSGKEMFVLPSIQPAQGSNIMRGSVAQHLDSAIDTALSKGAQEGVV